MGQGARFLAEDAGALKALGTAAQPIVFTGEQQQAGYWDGVQFIESPSRDNQLDFVEVRYAGGNSLIEGAVAVRSESFLSMTNSTVADSGSWGVCVTYIRPQYAATFFESNNTYVNNLLGNVVEDCD